MKRELIIACAVAGILSSCTTPRSRNELRPSGPRATEIHQALNGTVIPEVDLENLAMEDALQAWSKTSKAQQHPVRFDFRYAISYPTTFSVQPTKQAVVAALPIRPKITVRRKNITSARLLDEICRQSNFTWNIMGRVIIIKPRVVTSDTQP